MTNQELCNIDPNCLGYVHPWVGIIIFICIIGFIIGLFGVCSLTGWED